MGLALNKDMKLKELGLWEAPTEDQKRIVTLTAQITEQIQTFTAELQKSNQAKNTPAAPGNTPRAARTPFEKPKWMTTAPLPGKPHTITKNGKEYHWCPKHQAWGKHKPSECHKQAPAATPAPAPAASEPATGTATPRLQLTAGMTAIAAEEDEF